MIHRLDNKVNNSVLILHDDRWELDIMVIILLYVNVESLSCIPGFCIRAMLSLKWTVKDSLLLYFFKALGLCVCMLSHFSRVQLFVTPQTGAPQAPLSLGFSRQEYWSELSCPPQEDLPNPGMEPVAPDVSALQADSLLLRLGEAQRLCVELLLFMA